MVCKWSGSSRIEKESCSLWTFGIEFKKVSSIRIDVENAGIKKRFFCANFRSFLDSPFYKQVKILFSR